VIHVKTIERGSPAQITRRVWNDTMKRGYYAGVRLWFRRFLRKHFTSGAAHRYRYQPRSRKYEIRKARVKGHRRALEWSGTMKRQVLGHEDIKATGKGARASLRGPRWLYAYRRNLKQPDKATELTVFLADEEQAIGQEIDRVMTKRLNFVECV